MASVTFAGIEMSASGGSYQASVSQNGSYTVVAVDQAGNQQSTTVQVSGIDLTPPSIQVMSANNTWQKSQTVTFSVTDENSGVSAVQVTKDGAPVAYTESSGYQYYRLRQRHLCDCRHRQGGQPEHPERHHHPWWTPPLRQRRC